MRGCTQKRNWKRSISTRFYRTKTKTGSSKWGEEEKPLPDIGFKVYKLDTSNLTEWDASPVPGHDLYAFTQRLNGMVDSVKPDRTELDVVSEIMLKMGVPLDTAVNPVEINGKTAYAVGDFLLLICLADGITVEDMETIADYAPGKIVMADSCFADSIVMSNAYYILRDRGIGLKLV